jgi:phosphosulfolactate synthase (CoM biosynthesis protein A)|tara:strand:+ start:849 stop:1133 length:285 start_codon:yes stop_codon:yes gene_type:complete
MAVYRITRFAASDMDKAGEIAESIRDLLEGVGADFIDFVSYGNGKGVVIAKYPDQATMDAASDAAKEAFGKMIEAGAVDGDSVHPHTGVVFKSF